MKATEALYISSARLHVYQQAEVFQTTKCAHGKDLKAADPIVQIENFLGQKHKSSNFCGY